MGDESLHIPVNELIRRGVVSRAELLDGDVVLRPMRGRNRNLAVERRRGPSYFLKSAPSPPAPDRLAREAAIYRILAAGGPGFPAAPRLLDHLTDETTLALEFVPGGRNLADHRTSDAALDPAVGSALGAAVGALREIPAAEEILGLSRPWAFPLDAPDDRMLGTLSGGNLACLAILQEDGELPGLLSAFDQDWRSSCLMHGDIRLANVVLSPRPGGSPGIVLVDWEFAAVGDPAWDMGCLLAEYANLWLGSIPMMPGATELELVDLAGTPLASIRPAMRAAWDGFQEAAPGAPEVLRCVRAAGAAMAQIAFAIGQESATPAPQVLLRLQFAANVLREPGEAAAQVFGLVDQVRTAA